MKLTYTQRKEAMTEFAKDPSLDVVTIKVENGTVTITRSNQIVKWRNK